MKQFLLYIAIILSISASAQIGNKGSTTSVAGGLKIDSALQLPPFTPFTGKGAAFTGRIFIAADSLPGYMKAGIIKKVLTKWDSAVVYVDAGEVGQPNGVPSLNSSGVVPSAQLPAFTINGQVFIDTSQVQMLAHASATAGALSVRTDSSSALLVLTQLPSSTRGNWHVTQGNGVSAFNGRTGAITPTVGDYTTDLVTESPAYKYSTPTRINLTVAADTAAGWVCSGYRIDTTSAALRAAIASSGTAIGATITGATNGLIPFFKGSKLGQDVRFFYDTSQGLLRIKDGSGNTTAYISGFAGGTGATIGVSGSGVTGGIQVHVDADGSNNSIYYIESGGQVKTLPPAGLSANYTQYFRATNDSFAYLGDVPKWVKIATKSYTDFSIAANTRTINSGYVLPAKTVISGILVRPTTTFAGAFITAYTISIGGSLSGNTNLIPPARNVFTGAPNSFTNGLAMESFTLVSNITLTATSTGANLSGASQGVVEIYLLLSTLP